jgi:porphobilinogen synthase
MRELVRGSRVDVEKLIYPLFMRAGVGIKKSIVSMPGHFQWSVDQVEAELLQLLALGIHKVILFGIPSQKDPLGQESYSDQGIIQQAIRYIKNYAPEMLVIADVCLCEYTDHGHCGVVVDGDVENDPSVALLAQQAVSYARAGADIVAPSASLDFMVEGIRTGLDQAGFHTVPILSYAVKYSSSLYGPFRQAAEGAPQFGDRKTYQMDYANPYEGLAECGLDIEEGADMLMVKPAHAYLDIIYKVKQAYPEVPLGAYHTSGEFAMLKAAAEKGWLDERAAVLEILTAMYRAGADFVITYYAKEVAGWVL